MIYSDQYPSLSALHAEHDPFHCYVLSPGPGTPLNNEDFPPLQFEVLASNYPTLGVCLGHQAICHFFGATVTRTPSGAAHGLIHKIQKAPAANTCPLMKDLPEHFDVVRYHSLCALENGMSEDLIPTSWAPIAEGKDRVLMSVRHRNKPLFGIQFHPESICSQHGRLLVENFLRYAAGYKQMRFVPAHGEVYSEDETAVQWVESDDETCRNESFINAGLLHVVW